MRDELGGRRAVTGIEGAFAGICILLAIIATLESYVIFSNANSHPIVATMTETTTQTTTQSSTVTVVSTTTQPTTVTLVLTTTLVTSVTSTPGVSAVYAALIHGAAGAGLAVTCTGAQGSPTGGFVELSNVGITNIQVIAVSLIYGGNTYSATLTSCGPTSPINVGNVIFLQFTSNAPMPSYVGQQYSGFAALSNGAQVIFTGTFA